VSMCQKLISRARHVRRAKASMSPVRPSQMALVLRACSSLLLLLPGLAARASQDPAVELSVAEPLPIEAFQLRLARRTEGEGYEAGEWHALAKQGSFRMFLAPEVPVSGRDVQGVSVMRSCYDSLGNPAFGVMVFFRAAAWNRVRQFSSAHMDEVVATLVSGKIVGVARIRGAFDKKLAVCGAQASEAEANALAREMLGVRADGLQTAMP
jgi:hypothetical protein